MMNQIDLVDNKAKAILQNNRFAIYRYCDAGSQELIR